MKGFFLKVPNSVVKEQGQGQELALPLLEIGVAQILTKNKKAPLLGA